MSKLKEELNNLLANIQANKKRMDEVSMSRRALEREYLQLDEKVDNQVNRVEQIRDKLGYTKQFEEIVGAYTDLKRDQREIREESVLLKAMRGSPMFEPEYQTRANALETSLSQIDRLMNELEDKAVKLGYSVEYLRNKRI